MVCERRPMFVITTGGLWSQVKVCYYRRRLVIAGECSWLQGTGSFYKDRCCDHKAEVWDDMGRFLITKEGCIKRSVITTKGAWSKQVCVNNRFVIVREGFVITRTRFMITRERLVITSECASLQGKGSWLPQKICDLSKFVNARKGLWLQGRGLWSQQKVRCYNRRLVITVGVWIQ